jgi:hypothetical protein
LFRICWNIHLKIILTIRNWVIRWILHEKWPDILKQWGLILKIEVEFWKLNIILLDITRFFISLSFSLSFSFSLSLFLSLSILIFRNILGVSHSRSVVHQRRFRTTFSQRKSCPSSSLSLQRFTFVGQSLQRKSMTFSLIIQLLQILFHFLNFIDFSHKIVEYFCFLFSYHYSHRVAIRIPMLVLHLFLISLLVSVLNLKVLIIQTIGLKY